jgi:uncharacterized protein YutE (UPF0331/DUF86 family)
MKNGVIISKLQSLEQALQALQSLGTVTADQLRGDWKTRRAIERELQIAVEIVIDVCQRIISLAGQSPAATGADAVSRCVQLGVLSSVEPYRKMVQFRNFIVHHYEEVDLEILVDIVNHRLADFEKFRTEVLRYVQR